MKLIFVIGIMLNCTFAIATPPNSQLQQSHIQSLSKENTQKGINEGRLCSDEEGLSYELGEILKKNGKAYRCVKTLGEGFIGNTKLAWVEVNIEENKILLPL